jgi:hypothetical protein
MLIACRLVGLSALEAYYAGVRVRRQSGQAALRAARSETQRFMQMSHMCVICWRVWSARKHGRSLTDDEDRDQRGCVRGDCPKRLWAGP